MTNRRTYGPLCGLIIALAFMLVVPGVALAQVPTAASNLGVTAVTNVYGALQLAWTQAAADADATPPTVNPTSYTIFYAEGSSLPVGGGGR